MDIRTLFQNQPNVCLPTPTYWSNTFIDTLMPLVVKPAVKKIYSSAASYSHYFDPIDYSDGRLAGYSRNHGDASSMVQMNVMQKILGYSRDLGIEDRSILLSMARLESGFNPDAAATSSSAAGIFQFLDSTGKAYGLNDESRFDADSNIQAGVHFFKDNVNMFNKKFPGLTGPERAVMLYAFHHDGPSLQHGGESIAKREIVPYLDRFQLAVEAFDERSPSMTPST